MKIGDTKLWYFIDAERLRYEYPLNEDSIVFDIGASVGNWASGIIKKYNPTIVMFEPTDLIDQFKKTSNKQIIEKKAASYFDGPLFMGVKDGETSVYHESSRRSYPCVNLAEYIKARYNKIDLLKINIEGYEYRLISHLWNDVVLSNIDNIQVQFHLIDNDDQLSYRAVARQLSETHDLQWRFPFVWESWKRKEGT